ncbi:MAG: alpha/beta fold hydrolase [Oligoflexus sp.]
MGITRRQFRTVLLIELLILCGMLIAGYSFWHQMCDDTLQSCMSDSVVPEIRFLGLSLLRPFFFSPVLFMAIVGGANFGPLWGTLLTAFGAALAAVLVYYPGHYIGKRLIRPWLSTNLPNTWQLIRTQDYKLIFIVRWIPIFPFDLMSFFFGVADFHARRVFFYSFLGCLPTVILFANLASVNDSAAIGSTILNIIIFGGLTTLPLLAYEFISRKSGTSLWTQLKRVYYEIFYEVQINNEIIKRRIYHPDRVPIILLYGFFSSRRTLTVLERLLTQRGFDVMSFNLGGLFGVFFTRGIKETAEFLDRKVRRQIQRYQFEKVHIVAHSKGGLVALWWLLRMGGHQYCDKVVTMGTPFKGSWFTYLALITPLGFFWKDVWQMRPGSRFLVDLHSSPVYENVKIYNLYSIKDRVARGREGIFEYAGKVQPIPMHHITHFEFLYRRVVGDILTTILRNEEEMNALPGVITDEKAYERRRWRLRKKKSETAS